MMAALAGFILAARFGSTRPDIGNGLELIVITVTVLGGVSIFGGSGTMLGAILALILVGLLRFGMGLVNLQGQVQNIVIGLLLILSILLPRFGTQLSAGIQLSLIHIFTRGIDLSVGSMIGLTAMMVAFVMAAFPTLPPLLMIPLGMALGAALGSLNGLLIAGGGAPPIIVTLGTLSIYRGLIFLYSGSKSTINAFELPPGFRELAKGTPLGVPNLILFTLVVIVIVYYFLRYTRAGRDIYTVGSNPDAARFAGIPMQRVIFLVYVISGILCGLAGVLWAARCV